MPKKIEANTHLDTGAKESNFTLDFLLAGVSAAIGKTATAPLERVKLLLQNQITLKVIDKPYSGIQDCLSRLVKNEGFVSLWRGNVSNVVRYFPNQAMNFAFKDTFKSLFPKYDKNIHFWKFAACNCLAGGLAGSVSLSIVHPIDLARTRLTTDNLNQIGERKFSGSIDCIKKIYRHEGMAGVYRGMVVSIIGVFSYRALYFGGYDTVKGFLFKPNFSFIKKWTIAQFITVVAGIFCYPLDTIRRRVMVQSGEKIKAYNGAWDCSIKVYQQENIKGFYKGFGTNAIRTCGSSVVLVLYDEFQRLMGVSPRGGSAAHN
jgi:solute carrier family 25 (adenine nucleotide translocator) protein 4/5/6/31